jgi:hypothetical protein
MSEDGRGELQLLLNLGEVVAKDDGTTEAPKSTVLAVSWEMPAPEPTDW